MDNIIDKLNDELDLTIKKANDCSDDLKCIECEDAEECAQYAGLIKL